MRFTGKAPGSKIERRWIGDGRVCVNHRVRWRSVYASVSTTGAMAGKMPYQAVAVLVRKALGGEGVVGDPARHFRLLIVAQYSSATSSSISTGTELSGLRRSAPSLRGPDIQKCSPVSTSKKLYLYPLPVRWNVRPSYDTDRPDFENVIRPIRAWPFNPDDLSSIYMTRVRC